MVPIEVPVRRRLHHQPIYHLVFLTRSPYGLWEFADAIGRARQAYLRHLGQLEDDEVPGQQAMFGDPDDNDMEWLIEQEREAALRIVTDNLRGLLRQRPSIKLVDWARELFGDAYGIAIEPTVTKAVRDLQASGELTVAVQAKRLRDRVVEPRAVSARP